MTKINGVSGDGWFDSVKKVVKTNVEAAQNALFKAKDGVTGGDKVKEVNEMSPEELLENIQECRRNNKNFLEEYITNNIALSDTTRKSAVLGVYNKIANLTGCQSDTIRKIFNNELNKQFDSVGFVNTEKMERILEEMTLKPKDLGVRIKLLAKNETDKVYDDEYTVLKELITPDNVEDVLTSFSAEERLLDTILNGSWGDNHVRRDFAEHIYDALAEKYETPDDIKKLFMKELDEQIPKGLSKLISSANTERLDGILYCMKLSPKAIGEYIFSNADNQKGAIGKENSVISKNSDILISLISPKNVKEVLMDYTGKENIMHTILTEYSSDVQKRKDAAKHIFDALSEASNTPDSIKNKFYEELDSQMFDTLMPANSEKLDYITNAILMSPKQLGEKIYNVSGEKFGAVGTFEFDTLIELITPDIVESVLNDYTGNESLMSTIISEWQSDDRLTVNSAMHVYDALAEAKDAPPEMRNEFLEELNKQVNGFGEIFNNSKKLDEIINEILSL